MNNEMMPLVGFLLLSEDLQKQSNKIIQEFKNRSLQPENSIQSDRIIQEVKRGSLQAEDLDKQSDKIIKEVGSNKDVKKIADELVTNLSGLIKADKEFQENQSKKIDSLNDSITYLKQKIEDITEKLSGTSPYDRTQADNTSTGKEIKKSSKK